MPSHPTAPAAAMEPGPVGTGSGTAAARAAMVARLEESGDLGPGPVRDALLALPREVLMIHWMARPSVLAMADRTAAPHAVVAIMGDGSLWTHRADWTDALRASIQDYLGPDTGARAPAVRTPSRPVPAWTTSPTPRSAR